jgi:TATA-box binding protein (TBP) (component of TFIID and TFIIIB)
LYNSIFSVTQENVVTSTYLVEQVDLDEEGLVTVTASEYPYNALASAAGV